jgi:hypothetical protein
VQQTASASNSDQHWTAKHSRGFADHLNRVPVQQRISVRIVSYNYPVLLSCTEIVVFYLILTSIIVGFSLQSCQYLRLRIVGGKILSEIGIGKDMEGIGVP